MIELMPCPFCPPDESDPKLIHPGTSMFYVKCCSCGCMSGPVCMTAEQADESWNTRHERTCRVVVEDECPVCSECSEDIDPSWVACPYCGAKVVG